MLAETDMQHLKALAEKDPLVQKLLDFYCGITMDGVKAIRVTLNAQLLKLNTDLTKPDTNYDFTLDRICEVAKTLKKLPKDEVPEEKKEPGIKKEGKKKSVFDNAADEKR